MRRIAAGLLVAALAWLGFALLRPLPEPPERVAPQLASLPEMPSERGATADRSNAVARLTRANVFTIGRGSFASAVATTDDDGNAPSETDDAADAPVADRPAPPAASDDGTVVVAVDRPEDVDADLRESFGLFDLRGIHTDRSGALRASVAPKHAVARNANQGLGPGGGARRSASRSVAPGDVFDVPRDPNASRVDEWTVLAIDPSRNRVVFTRERRNLAKSLFSGQVADTSPVRVSADGEASDAQADEPSGPTVVTASDKPMPSIERRSQLEVLEKLRQAEVDGADIEEIFRLMGETLPGGLPGAPSSGETADDAQPADGDGASGESNASTPEPQGG
jgi:hypothetical protein